MKDGHRMADAGKANTGKGNTDKGNTVKGNGSGNIIDFNLMANADNISDTDNLTDDIIKYNPEVPDNITGSFLTEGEKYIYDRCGNRTGKETIRNGLVDLRETYCYNEKNQLTERQTHAGVIRYAYDANGNLLSENGAGNTKEYRYDLLDRQSHILTADGMEQENRYDGEGYRTGLTIDGISYTFLFHDGEILAESDGAGNPVRRHLNGIGHSLSLAQTLSDHAYHAYHQDDQGSTAYITGMDGEAENSYLYDAFGNLLESREAIGNRILFTGQQYDQEMGQYYLRARYYNPTTSRMLSEDTYRGDGLNLYAYCSNNPVTYYDWSGYAKKSNCPPPEQEELATTPTNNENNIRYGELDELNRPTGVSAVITEDMIKTGTPANSTIIPPGFEGGGPDSAGHARGHLLGSQLGGSGDDPRNLVTLYQNPTNHPVMSGYERQIRNAVEGGQTVAYTSQPIYQGNNLVPSGVTLNAQGSDGFSLYVTILNRKK